MRGLNGIWQLIILFHIRANIRAYALYVCLHKIPFPQTVIFNQGYKCLTWYDCNCANEATLI